MWVVEHLGVGVAPLCLETSMDLTDELRMLAEDKNADANARLIAAAPDLLDELLSILDWAVTERAPLRNQEIKSIRKVIAKATGEQQ